MPFGMSNHTVDVLRANYSRGNSGEYNEAWVIHIAGLACRVQRKSSREEVYAGADRFMSDAVLYCNPGTDIQEKDRIDDAGQRYEVKGIDPNHDNMNAYCKVELLKVG